MKMLKNLRITIPLAAGFMLLATGQSVWAEGCTVSDLEPDQIVDVGDFDGNMSCENWVTMEAGCSLDPDDGGPPVDCPIVTSNGTITVTAEKINGAVTWSAVSDTAGLGVDKVILDNATNANGCLQNNKVDAFGGSIVFIKSNGLPSTTRGVEFCADEQASVAPSPPEVAEVLPNCNLTNKLDDTGIQCPLDESGMQKPVVVCNFEKDKKDWGVTDGTDVCCQCGVDKEQFACVVTEDETVDNACTKSMTVDPTQAVEFTLFRSDDDPCTWLRSSRGWVQWCW